MPSSNTGKYIWDGQELVKYSDDIPKLGYVAECSIGQSKGQQHHVFTTADIDGKLTEYRDRRQLYDAMKKNKIRQAPKQEYRSPNKKPDVGKVEKTVVETVNKLWR